MSSKTVTAAYWAAIAAAVLGAVMFTQVATASDNSTYAMSQVVAQVPTPTPFRFLTPTPIVPRSTTSTTTTAPSTTTTTTTTAPRTGGFPLELAMPALAGGLTAIGGGSFLLRRKTAR